MCRLSGSRPINYQHIFYYFKQNCHFNAFALLLGVTFFGVDLCFVLYFRFKAGSFGACVEAKILKPAFQSAIEYYDFAARF